MHAEMGLFSPGYLVQVEAVEEELHLARGGSRSKVGQRGGRD